MIVQTGTHMRSFPLRTQRQIATFEVCGWVPLDCVITLGIAFAPSAFARRCVVEGIDPDVRVASVENKTENAFQPQDDRHN